MHVYTHICIHVHTHAHTYTDQAILRMLQKRESQIPCSLRAEHHLTLEQDTAFPLCMLILSSALNVKGRETEKKF